MLMNKNNLLPFQLIVLLQDFDECNATFEKKFYYFVFQHSTSFFPKFNMFYPLY